MKKIIKAPLSFLITLPVIFYLSFQTQLFAASINPKYISIGDGLASGYVMSIFQDSYGLLWIGTDNGLHLYDGNNFTRYKNIPIKESSLLSNNSWGITEDKKENIWISTEIGVSKYSRKSNSFKNYNFDELFDPGSGIVFNIFCDSKGRIWAASQRRGLLWFDEPSDKWNQIKIQLKDTVVADDIFAMSITEDQEGRIWSGSDNFGLIYLDANDSVFKQVDQQGLKNKIDFTDLSSENRITGVYADLTNTIWVTARNGIYKYSLKEKSIKTIKTYKQHKKLLFNHWNKIFQDNNGNIWITNNFRGILKFDGISDEYTEIEIEGRFRAKDGTLDIIVTDAILDKTGIIWFGSTSQGLLKYDPYNEPFDHYVYDDANENSISQTQIFGLLESNVHKGEIYVGTRGGHLNLYNEDNKTFKHIKYNAINDPFGGSVRSIYEEEDGSLLIGTWGDGLVVLDKNYKEITRYTNDSLSFNSLTDNAVRVIKKDNQGNYWIGTNGGLNVLSPKSKLITRIPNEASKVYPQELINLSRYLLKESNAVSIKEVGDYQNLTKEINVQKPRSYLIISAGEGFGTDSIMYDYGFITNSTNDTIWNGIDAFSTFHCGGAIKNRLKIGIIDLVPGNYKLNYISDDSHSFGKWNANKPTYPQFWGIHAIELDNELTVTQILRYIEDANNIDLIQGFNIRSIHIARNTVWIGTNSQGLNKIDQINNIRKNYRHDEFGKNSISNNNVQFIHEAQNGILWLATDAGLNRFDPVKEHFTVYTEDDGLPTNYISSILPGDNDDLWIATRSGISKMVTDKESGQVTFVNYDSEDGLGGMDFIALVALKSGSGQYYFGGEHGLNVFTPIESNTKEPDLVFIDLKISNKSIIGYDQEDSPIDKPLIETESITLNYDQNDLTFQFAALHYSNPGKNQYAHKLNGYDNEWIFDNKREVTYTNLDPGEYSFSIKGSNRDGVWASVEKAMKIIITPPWWFTTWAYIGYGLTLIGGIFAVDRIQRRRLLSKAKERMKLQEAEMRAESAELQAKAAEAERKLLESENKRKSDELEEARELQLSMLPKELPSLPHLDIAVYMKTATEVGGDYYDFHISMDGKLTVVLGDATGHGMKAGTMVTTTKSLFNVLAPNPNIVKTFHEMTRCLKLMHLEKLSMCMTMLKISENKLQMSAAGMPPVFIYKRENQITEEHVMKGMPLGTFSEFPYSIIESDLNSGDVILLMSDGLPELVNSENEIFGYKRVRNLFEEVAGMSPEDIIRKLKDAGSDWVNDTDPNDDVSFVVIKVK